MTVNHQPKPATKDPMTPEPQKPEHSPSPNIPGIDNPSDTPRPQTDPSNQPIA